MDNYYNEGVNAATTGMLLGSIIFSLIFALLIYLFVSFLYMRIFNKAGREGWKAFIPIYNTWVLFEICYLPGWLVLFSIVPCLNIVSIVFSFIANYRLPQCFEKSKGWGVLGIFLPIVTTIVCAFDSSEYCGYGEEG